MKVKEKSVISLRRAVPDDSEFLFQLRNERSVRENSTNTEIVTFDTHLQWYAKKLEDPNTHLFVVLANGERIGQTRVDIHVQENHGVIRIAIAPEHRRHGYASVAIRETCLLVFSESSETEQILAYIKTENSSSIRAFKKAGFSQDDVVKIKDLQHNKMVLRKKEYLTDQLSGLDYIPPFPKVLRIEPASACNFKCVHCPTGLGMNPNVGIMSMDIFDKIFEKIKQYYFRVIVMFFGGESLLNKNFFEIAKRLRPLTDRIELNSNGSFLSDKLIGQMLAADVIDRLAFSLDGNSAKENDKIRIGANFQKIALNIKKLITTRNALGLQRPKIFIANTQIPETVDPGNRIEVPQFLRDAFQEVESDINYKCTYALIWAGMNIKLGSVKPDNNFCDQIVNTFTIRANSDVVPCCYDLTTETLMGNVFQQSPEEIWRNKRFVGLRKSIAAFNPPKLCQGCEVLYPKALMTKRDIKIK